MTYVVVKNSVIRECIAHFIEHHRTVCDNIQSEITDRLIERSNRHYWWFSRVAPLTREEAAVKLEREDYWSPYNRAAASLTWAQYRVKSLSSLVLNTDPASDVMISDDHAFILTWTPADH